MRSRTRLTNLAVALILLLTGTSLMLNISNYLSDPTYAHAHGPTGSWTPKGKGKGEGKALYEGEREERGSIERTINRDIRMEKLEHMVMVPGHAIWTGSDPSKVAEDGEWVLEPMQRGGSVRTFLRHLEEGVRVMKEDPGALLVFSG